MNYSQRLKNSTLVELDILKIDLMLVCCQFNPDRFHHYQKVVLQAFPTAENYDILRLNLSPHVWYALRYYHKTNMLPTNPYQYMQLLYGKSASSIIDKVSKFNELLDSVQKEGIREDNLPIVLIQPFQKNKYNGSLEIYEGHHRLAAAFANGNCIQKVRLCKLEEKYEYN